LLGDSEVLGIDKSPRNSSFRTKHITSVRPFSPCREEWNVFSGQRSEEASKGVISGIQRAENVFPDRVGRVEKIDSSRKGQREITARVREGFTVARE
jgi:hypothetical protein